MHSYILRCELKSPKPVEEVFSIFEDPYNLAVLTPPWLHFKVTSKDRVVMRKGAEIDYTIRWMGVPVRWKTIITEYDPPYRFIDTQARGPYVLWHHLHVFHPVSDGVIVSDQVRYVLPLGPLGRVAHQLLVGGQLLEIFRYRQMKIGELLGGSFEVKPPYIESASAVTKEDLADYRAY